MIEQIIFLSLVTASISFTISETRFFARLREKAQRFPLVGEAVRCGYCLGHWVSFGLTAIYRPRLFETWWLLDYFLTSLAIAWLAAFQWGTMCWLMDKAGK